MARRIILCDGAESARLWARIGADEDEDLLWVPREGEARARPAGFRSLPGRLSAESIAKLAVRAMWAGALATCMTACLAGVFGVIRGGS